MPDVLRVGSSCLTYWSTGTAYESPTWQLSKLIDSESINLSKTQAEFKSRRSKFKRKKGSLIEASASFSVEFADGDAFFAALLDSFLNDTVIDMAFMFDDIATSGSEGIRMPVEVFEFPLNRDLEEGVKFDVEVGLTEQVDVGGDLVDLEYYIVP